MGIYFLGVIRNKTKISDHVVTTTVNLVHANSCDPSHVGPFVLSRTQSSDYNRYGDEVLREIMVQMTIDPFVNVRAMTELLQKTLPGKNDVNRHVINNVRLRTRRKKSAVSTNELRSVESKCLGSI